MAVMNMGETKGSSILRRKATDGSTEHQARAMSPTKAMRLGLAKAAEKGLDLALDVTKVTHTTLPHRALQEILDEESLLAILEGQNGEPGAMAVDMQVLAGLVEFQTLGQVIPKPVVDRVPTRVDAALITPLMEDALMRFVRNLGEEGEPPKWLQHYKFGAMVADRRTLSLGMMAQDYHMFVMDITLEHGKKTGTMAWIFPDIEVLVEGSDEEEKSGAEKFQSTVKQATTTLNAVIGKVSMPIAQIQGLQVGDVLKLPEDPIKSAKLEALGGEVIADARIGQLDGMRAVCVPGLAGAALASGLTNGLAGASDMGGLPGMDEPAMPAMGGMPDMGGDLPAMGGMPDMDTPALPDLSGGGLPDLDGGMPDMGGDLPDLGGGLPDLDGGGLPDLGGDLPDLDSTGGIGLDADSGEDFGGLDDLDDLINLGSDDIGDPMALADLDLPGT
ncbi:FliM/FliN family flagellar motor C-terminal domain-containing protein [Shimia sp.]|uniref:FliM/FliN family flagellar motor C-terminal domain-containing protein n=1 Tax=Shimia sp. TaxID=1954381 RepID=UPI003BAC01DE